jgi:spermidine synthase
MHTYKINYRIFLILAFFSGFPVLIYEIVWARMLVNLLGSSVYSVTITTATFMLGMAMGAYLFGHYADNTRRYLKLYAVIEFGIGLSALTVPALVAGIKTIKFNISPFVDFPYALFISQRMVMVFFVLMIPSIFMGGILPVLSRFIRKDLNTSGRMLAHLYSFNTFGSIIGCLLAIFLMVGHLGLLNTLTIASAVNLFIGVASFILEHRFRPIPAVSSGKAQGVSAHLLNPRQLLRGLSSRQKLLLFAFGLSGFTALAYEVLWIRMLIFWLKNTMASFGLILAVFLWCIVSGSFVSSRLIDKFSEKQLRHIFAYLELFIGIAALSAIYLYSWGVRTLMKETNFWPLHHLYYNIDLKSGVLVTFLTFFLIAFPFGMVFPLALRLLLPGSSKISGHVGLSYTINTLGAAVGALATGLVLIPFLGVQKSIYIVSFINVLIFCLVFVFHGNVKISRSIVALGAVLAVFMIQALIPGNYLEKTMSSKIKDDIVFFEEGSDGTIIVSKAEDGSYLLWINGMITSFPGRYMQYRGHIPALLSLAPKDALVIGFGSGVTLGVVSEVYGIKTDCIEISRSVIDAGRIFSKWNYDALDSDNVNIIIMDARNFVELTKKKYDIIIVDASQPVLANTNSLFSREFYAACYNILNEDGVMLQWMPAKDENNYRRLAKTFISVFDNAYFFREDNMIGAKKTLLVDQEVIGRKILQNEAIARELRSIGINSSGDLSGLLIAGKDELVQLTKGAPVITDDRPFIEFSAFGN